MLPIEMSRAQQSRAHLLTLKGLNGSIGFPSNPQEAASAALAEMVALHSNCCDLNYSDVFTLSEAILAHRDEHCETAAAEYDLLSLHNSCGCLRLARMALRLCGAYHVPDTNSFVDGDGERTRIVFPSDFWKEHLRMMVNTR
jgi:hypothetical protein